MEWLTWLRCPCIARLWFPPVSSSVSSPPSLFLSELLPCKVLITRLIWKSDSIESKCTAQLHKCKWPWTRTLLPDENIVRQYPLFRILKFRWRHFKNECCCWQYLSVFKRTVGLHVTRRSHFKGSCSIDLNSSVIFTVNPGGSLKIRERAFRFFITECTGRVSQQPSDTITS